MKKNSLNDSVFHAYSVVNTNVLGIKSCIINLCSDIDRYFTLRFGVGISSKVGEDDFRRITRIFPSLSNMTISQFNKYIELLSNIRNINAHLHLCQRIMIESDLEKYLSSLVTPAYKVSINGELTVYGQSFVLVFLSQKYNLWPFITSFFSNRFFSEFSVMNGKEKSKFQTDYQHQVQEYCGIGKPLYPDYVKSMEWQYMNDLFKYHMTRIIYAIEKECNHTSRSFTNSWSISRGLRNSSTFKNREDVIDLIIFLRNCWFHGTNLNDEIEFNDVKMKLTYKFIFESFISIKRCILNGNEKFDSVIHELNDFATNSLNFYALRLVEVSYKVLDNRLLTEDKVDSRIDNLSSAYERFLKADNTFYELSGKLIEPNDLEFYVSGCKFLDSIPRKTICRCLRILNIHCENGIQIGEFHTDKKDITLAIVDLEEKYQNKINGHSLADFQLFNEKKYGERISTFSINQTS